MRRLFPAAAAVLAASLAGVPLACVGTAGGEKFAFDAVVGGIEREPSRPYEFTNDYGWSVELTQADFFLGPLYLNTIAPLGGQGASRWLPWPVKAAWAGDAHLGGGRLVGELLGQVSFSALSPGLTPFPARGVISAERVRSAEIYFYPPADVPPETSKIAVAAVAVAGRAERGGEVVKFRGKLVLDDTWQPSAQAGDRDNTPITAIRQVRGVAAGFLPTPGGRLELRVDASRLFTAANFSDLAASPADLTDPSARALVQAKSGKFTTDPVMRGVYQGLRASRGTYAVTWK